MGNSPTLIVGFEFFVWTTNEGFYLSYRRLSNLENCLLNMALEYQRKSVLNSVSGSLDFF